MRHLLALAVVSLVAALPASASLIEDTLAPTGLGLHYQEDAGVPGDAPGTCADADPGRQIRLGDAASAGMLLEVDDEADAFILNLGAPVVGERVGVSLLTALLMDRFDVSFDVLGPGCGSSVFDPESEYYEVTPEDPYTVLPGQSAFNGRVDGYDCDSNGWKFLANQMHGLPAPADIYVEWTNGDYAYVPVSKSTPATVAHYRTVENLDVTVARIVIVLPATWSGQFHIASGPCDAVPGVPDPAPQLSSGYGEFTAQQSGPHVIVVSISRGTAEKTVDTVQDLVNSPPMSIAMTCHDVCSLALQYTSYDLGSSLVTA